MPFSRCWNKESEAIICMQRSPWEAHSFLASQELDGILRKPKFHICVRKSLPLNRLNSSDVGGFLDHIALSDSQERISYSVSCVITILLLWNTPLLSSYTTLFQKHFTFQGPGCHDSVKYTPCNRFGGSEFTVVVCGFYWPWCYAGLASPFEKSA
jgi:hypothetical protein